MRLEADHDDVTPWATVQLTARITPADAARTPLQWSWTTDGVVFATEGPIVEWHRQRVGDHLVVAEATDADGVKHSAQITLHIRLRPYVTESGQRIEPANEAIVTAETAQAAPPLPFSIADVWVEKSEVCQGEPSRIRVTPADKRGKEAWLTPIINGVQSWEVPFVASPSAPGLRRVSVMVSDAKPGDSKRDYVHSDVYIEVKDCIAPFPIYVEASPIPPDPEYIGFTVHLFDGPRWEQVVRNDRSDGGVARVDPTASAAGYVWDFGDGKSSTSTAARIAHRFPPEEERSGGRATSYTVKVEALDASGKKLATGYAAVALRNPYLAQMEDMHVLQLVTHVPAGPAPSAEDGSRTVQVKVRNLDNKETAQLTEVKAKYVPCDGRDGVERSAQMLRMFENDSVAPRDTIEGKLTVSKEDAERSCSVVIELVGRSVPSGYRVTGFFALDTGRRPSVPLTAAQTEVMSQARALLGNPKVVSVDDIRKLEDEGKIPRGALDPDPKALPVVVPN